MSHSGIYSHKTLTQVTLLLCLITIANCQGQSCQLQSIPVQSAFDPQKYAGKWYELKWLPGYFETEDSILVDYTETYEPSEDGATIVAEGRGRSPHGDTFITFSKTYTKAEEAKYFTTINYVNSSSLQVDYWIIATDYEHYSLCYGCTIPEEGVCQQAHAWIWSRTRDLEDKYYKTISTYLPQLCLTESDFRILAQNYSEEVHDMQNTSTILSSTGILFHLVTVVALFCIHWDQGLRMLD